MKNLVKTLITFITYFGLYEIVFNIFKFNNSILNLFIFDILYIVFIVVFYFKELKEDLKDFKKGKFSKIIKKIICYILIIFILNIIMGLIVGLILPNSEVIGENSKSIINLFDISFWYTMFKTIIFASFAEEIMFRKSISSIINNKFLFIIISSIIYASINVMYTDLSSNFMIIDFISYFILSVVICIAYVKNNNNIFYPIFIKLIYNLIPTIILFSGVLK